MTHIPDVCQQHLKRVPIELLPPHKFNKVGIQLGPVRPTLPLVPLLGHTPHRLHMVCGGMRLWIHKVKAVFHRQVLVSHVANGIIGGPQVRHDGGTRQNVLLQYWEQSRRIPLWNSHKEAVLGLNVDSSKHPLGVYHPANIGLPPDECRLVNLHDVAGPPICSGCLMKYSAKMSLT